MAECRLQQQNCLSTSLDLNGKVKDWCKDGGSLVGRPVD